MSKKPLWKGPAVDGITFSLLSRFLVCRERFRLRVVEGLVEDEGFNASMEYGTLFHEAEEAHRKGKPWDLAIKKYRTKLLANYPGSEADIHKWSAICLKQYPLYLDHWRKHADETQRKPLLAEASFKVPYKLPSGRVVLLRGKFDAVTVLPTERKAAPRDSNKTQKGKRVGVKSKAPELGIFLQENKTKGQIDEEGILGTVSQNLQSMLYQIALREIVTPDTREFDAQETTAIYHTKGPKTTADLNTLVINYHVAGTLYNVIRRPLADRFAIKQREGRTDKKTGRKVGAETAAEFYERVADVIREKPEYFFLRWKVLLDDEDIARFKQRVFDPILEQLLDWWEWINLPPGPFNPWATRGTLVDSGGVNPDGSGVDIFTSYPPSIHFQTPWGIYNSMFGGFRGDYFEYLTKDRQYRLSKITTLFPELT